jgi:hypothetical protein
MENNILLTDRELLISKLAVFLDTARRDQLSVDDLLELQGEFQPSITLFHTPVSRDGAASDACLHYALQGHGHWSCFSRMSLWMQRAFHASRKRKRKHARAGYICMRTRDTLVTNRESC